MSHRTQLTHSPLNVVSLFSGCGGLDLGFQQEGFSVVAAFDINPAAVEHYKANLGARIAVADLSAGGASPLDLPCKAGVVIASPPCQGFSTAGKRELDDPRNTLLLAAGQIGVQLKPRVFVLENVSGAASGQHSRYWDALGLLFRDNGYKTTTLKCQAATMGVPQIRTRLIFLAWKTPSEPYLALPERSKVTLEMALKAVEDAPDHAPRFLPSGSRALAIAEHIGPGQKLCNVRRGARSVHTWDIPEIFGTTSYSERAVLEAMVVLRRRDRVRSFGDADPVNASTISRHLRRSTTSDVASLVGKGYMRRDGRSYDLTHTFNGKHRRLSWEAPSLTVDTRFGDPRYFLHPSENRGFSVREVARIQGFPDSFRFSGPERQSYMLLGNAVPPPMAREIAALVKGRLLV
jgi:DNA (cytosine-5)-methyltransferase 1